MAKKQASPPVGLFTAQDLHTLRQHRHNLATWLTQCDKAKACGVDVEALRQMRDEVESQLAAIEQHFMAGL